MNNNDERDYDEEAANQALITEGDGDNEDNDDGSTSVTNDAIANDVDVVDDGDA